MAGQKYPNIGLRVVLDLSGFSRPYSQYQRMMRDIDRTTKQTAQSVNQTTSNLFTPYATSLTDLIDQSALLRNALTGQGITFGNNVAVVNALTTAFNNLGSSARVNVNTFNHLLQSGVSLGNAFAAAAGQVSFNVNAFNQLIQSGVSASTAFSQVAGQAQQASGTVSLLGGSFSTTAVAVSAATAALRIALKVVRDSIEAYDELQEATRRVRTQTGLLAQEASTWVSASEAAGISTATSERAMTSFLSKAADLNQELREGKTPTSDFSRALDVLNIELRNGDETLKSTEQLLEDVSRAFQQFGPGAISARDATALFGYSGRLLLPLLADTEMSLIDVIRLYEDLGAGLTELDQNEYAEFRRANIELQATLQGLRNQIARPWNQLRTEVVKALADIITSIRQLFAIAAATQDTYRRLTSGALKWADALDYLSDRTRYYYGLENEASRAAAEAAQARRDAAQQTADDIATAERKIREEREKTLEQLDDLKTRLAQKLADMARDAERHWEDIYVNRAREAFDRALQLAWRMEDLRAALNDRLDSIEEDFAKRWDDILVKRQRDAIERAMRLGWRLEDLARETEQRRFDAIRDYNEREAEQRDAVLRRIEDAERDAAERREDLERDHQRRLRDIQLDYLDTIQEAARKNDAVAVARAARERARAVRDEATRYADEQEDLATSLARKRADIERDRQEREQDQRDELARTLRRIEENHQRQLEELARQQAREAILRAQQYRWEREDFDKAKAEQLVSAQEWYDDQLKDLTKAQERERIQREIQYRRQLEDFNRTQRRQLEDAQYWYAQERNELAEHLNMTTQQLERYYLLWQAQAAQAAAEAAKVISSAYAYATSRQRSWGPPPMLQGWDVGMAEGGVIHATSPTTVLMGEAGPETAVFIPGGAGGSMNVNHTFGRMGVDFQGLPGGMNTQQIQSIVYSVMTQLAKGIQVPGRQRWQR